MSKNLRMSSNLHSQSAGYVYVLVNESMPGLVKIGRSVNGGRSRANDLYKQGGTGVPTPFEMLFEIWCEDCVETELSVHEELSNCRVNKNREFFKISRREAIKAVVRVACYEQGLSVGDEDESVMESDIMPSYGREARQLINELFPTAPHSYVLASALRSYLTIDAVKDAVIKYKEVFDRNLEEWKSGSEEQVKTTLKVIK